MSLKSILKEYCPSPLFLALRVPYRIAMWPYRAVRHFVRTRTVSRRALKYLPFYQDELSREILFARIQYIKTGDLCVFLDLAEKEGLKTSPLYAEDNKGWRKIDSIEHHGITVIYDKAGKNLDYTKRLLAKEYGGNSFRTMTAKEFLSGGEISGSELLILVIQDWYIRKRIDDYVSASGLTNPMGYWIASFREEAQYFDVFQPANDEIVVDAGAYDGNTAISFLRWGGDKIKRVYAFEFDPDNAEKCEKNIEPYTDKITLVRKGTWDTDTTLYASTSGTSGTSGSNVNSEGDTKVQLTAIDNIVKDEPVTFIKMDVEGAELKSLMGAKNTIIKNRPRLAICVYHKPQDIYEIPGYILSIVPDYKFRLRHYSSQCFETVLYAYCE